MDFNWWEGSRYMLNAFPDKSIDYIYPKIITKLPINSARNIDLLDQDSLKIQTHYCDISFSQGSKI